MQKLEINKKVELGTSVVSVREQCCVKKQMVFDIRKSKDKLMKYAALYYVDASSSKSGKVENRKP